MAAHFKRAFTILELSIVFVIIALMMAGSLKFSHYIRNQEIKSLMTESDKFYQAIQSFYDLYNQIPGDMSNASTLISSDITNDGDGDDVTDGYNSDEGLYAWEHLYYANFINMLPIYEADIPSSETITCPVGSVGEAKYPGFNIPWIKTNNSSIAIGYMQGETGVDNDLFITFVIGNGKTCNYNNVLSSSGILTNSEAKLLYDKYYGKIPRPAALGYSVSKDLTSEDIIIFATASSTTSCDYTSTSRNNQKVCYLLYRFELED